MQRNAQIIAEFLANHPKVTEINYPGLRSDPGYELHHSQARFIIIIAYQHLLLYALNDFIH